MKKLLFIATVFVALTSLPACEGNTAENDSANDANVALVDSLQNAMAERDSLLTLMSEISDGMTQIKAMENILNSTNLNSETPSKREEIKNDLVLLQQTLVDRRNRLDELEKKLARSNNYTESLKAEITKLKEQITSQEEAIAGMSEQLKAAKIQIETLNVRVDSLRTENTNVANERDAAQQEAIERTNELNTCYFVIGTKSELKKYKVIESGFLRKTKVLEGDYSMSCFTKADKRTLKELPLFSKKAQVMTNHASGSYQLVDKDGSKVLVITDQAKFWERSNFLIVKVD